MKKPTPYRKLSAAKIVKKSSQHQMIYKDMKAFTQIKKYALSIHLEGVSLGLVGKWGVSVLIAIQGNVFFNIPLRAA